jgi:class 3 adenylate cyclase
MKSRVEMEASVVSIFATDWQRREGRVVPDSDSVRLGNDAVEIDATVLYADLADSTGLVKGYKDWFAAEIYKAYLTVACDVIRNNGGIITAFDGDRVMAVYLGSSKNSSAAKSALQISWAMKDLINPKLKARYPKTSYEVRQAVGIDTGKLMVAKAGIRGFNDLIWVGKAANIAAKLSALRDSGYGSFITAAVYSSLNESSKMGGDPKRSMWKEHLWAETGEVVMKSNWQWKPA